MRTRKSFGPNTKEDRSGRFTRSTPRQHAILLIGGDKTGDDRFYDRMIPLAERLYDEYLEELRKEGLIP